MAKSGPSELGPMPPPPNRCVLSDDGETIRLLMYASGLPEPLGVADLSPEQAMRLCADLAVAAAAHLARQRNGRIGVRRGPAQ